MKGIWVHAIYTRQKKLEHLFLMIIQEHAIVPTFLLLPESLYYSLHNGPSCRAASSNLPCWLFFLSFHFFISYWHTQIYIINQLKRSRFKECHLLPR